MKVLNLVVVTLLFFLLGCSKEEIQPSDCIASVLKENDMVEYTGQEIGCKFFFQLFDYENEQFFLLGNHCADMVSYPIDCEGNHLYEDLDSQAAIDFYANAEHIGIIGISE